MHCPSWPMPSPAHWPTSSPRSLTTWRWAPTQPPHGPTCASNPPAPPWPEPSPAPCAPEPRSPKPEQPEPASPQEAQMPKAPTATSNHLNLHPTDPAQPQPHSTSGPYNHPDPRGPGPHHQPDPGTPGARTQLEPCTPVTLSR